MTRTSLHNQLSTLSMFVWYGSLRILHAARDPRSYAGIGIARIDRKRFCNPGQATMNTGALMT